MPGAIAFRAIKPIDMMDRTTPDPDEGVRRFLVDRRAGDRRSGKERRRRERRVLDIQVALERRSGEDRRAGRDRRAMRERRLPLAAQFSWDETRTIQDMLAHPEVHVACPRCDGVLLLGPHESHEGVTTREVHCTGCKNSAVIVE